MHHSSENRELKPCSFTLFFVHSMTHILKICAVHFALIKSCGDAILQYDRIRGEGEPSQSIKKLFYRCDFMQNSDKVKSINC